MFDAHCHLQFAAFDEDREEAVHRATRAGVKGLIIADYDAARRAQLSQIAESHEGMWFVAGLHPWAVANLDEHAFQRELHAIEMAHAHPRCVGIGEVGLDLIRAVDLAAEDAQVQVLRTLLDLARNLDAPLVIHCIRAEERLLSLLKADGVPNRGGMMHSFSGSAEQAKQFVSLGFDISVGPGVLRQNARKILEVVRQVPEASLMIETDSPDQPPTGYTRNEPSLLPLVAAKVADVLDREVVEVADFTEQNVRRRFGLGTQNLSSNEVLG